MGFLYVILRSLILAFSASVATMDPLNAAAVFSTVEFTVDGSIASITRLKPFSWTPS